MSGIAQLRLDVNNLREENKRLKDEISKLNSASNNVVRVVDDPSQSEMIRKLQAKIRQMEGF